MMVTSQQHLGGRVPRALGGTCDISYDLRAVRDLSELRMGKLTFLNYG